MLVISILAIACGIGAAIMLIVDAYNFVHGGDYDDSSIH